MILAVDTSGAFCAACVLREDSRDVIACRSEAMGRGQAERLMPMIEELLAECDAGFDDLDAIGVCTGPGNFTGIRIGVAAARGLGLGLACPVVGASNFDVIAAAQPQSRWATVSAPRDSVYLSQIVQGRPQAPEQATLDKISGLDGAVTALDTISIDVRVQHIARITADRYRSDPSRPAPLYVRAADAAPSRDAPPVILDAS